LSLEVAQILRRLEIAVRVALQLLERDRVDPEQLDRTPSAAERPLGVK